MTANPGLNEEINTTEQPDEDLVISKGGLYSPFPIPAYKILSTAKEHIAKDVLLCLVSHLGKGKKKAFPSIALICKEAGRGRSSVIGGIRVLEHFGFVNKFQYWEPGKRKRSIYYLQEACWNNDQMNKEALEFAPIIGRCGCGEAVRLGEIGLGSTAFHHYGCGDVVHLLSTKKTPAPVVLS